MVGIVNASIISQKFIAKVVPQFIFHVKKRAAEMSMRDVVLQSSVANVSTAEHATKTHTFASVLQQAVATIVKNAF